MSEPRFTVIIPTLGEESLAQAVMSAVEQMKDGDEVLVCPDGKEAGEKIKEWFFKVPLPQRHMVRVLFLNNQEPLGSWGHPIRNRAMEAARGSHLLFFDADDAYAPGAFDTIREKVKASPQDLHIFKMKYVGGTPWWCKSGVLWKEPRITGGNVSTQMYVVPNKPEIIGRFGLRYEGDWDFAAETAKWLTVSFHSEVIAHIKFRQEWASPPTKAVPGSKMVLTNHIGLERGQLPDPCDMLTFTSPGRALPVVGQPKKIRRRLDVFCHEVYEQDLDGHNGLKVFDEEQAKQVVEFLKGIKEEHLVISCEGMGGRSEAAAAAFLLARGAPQAKQVFAKGSYNPLIFRKIMEAYGMKDRIPPQPKVSLAVSVFYPLDRFRLFMLSMERQRYTNWEVVAITDGPYPELTVEFIQSWLDSGKVRLIQTAEHKGSWCHHHRQKALDACAGEIIGMSNDDNYYTPGYLEQMVYTLQEERADLAICDSVHSYLGWKHCEAHPEKGNNDLGCWLARASLVRMTPWDGTDFASDAAYVRQLADTAGPKKVALLHRPLFIKN